MSKVQDGFANSRQMILDPLEQGGIQRNRRVQTLPQLTGSGR